MNCRSAVPSAPEFVGAYLDSDSLSSDQCLARKPQRISNRLEHSPLMMGSHNAIPIEDGERFHGRREPLVSQNSWVVR